MKIRHQEALEQELTIDETRTKESTSETENNITSKGSESSLEVMGVAVAQPIDKGEPHVTNMQLQGMLSKELTNEEQDAYLEVL